MSADRDRFHSEHLVGSIPSNWEIKPLFSVLDEVDQRNVNGSVSNVLSLSYGRIVRRSVENNFGLLPESFATYQVVREGDIVLRLLDLQNDQVSLRSGLVREDGIVTSAYVALRPRRVLRPDFVAYLLHSYDIRKIFYSYGGGCRQSMTYDDLKRLPIVLPSIPEQERIARYLDEETGKVDRLIALRRRQMELLREQKAAMLQQAVTRGLHPHVSIKSSRLPWLCSIPAHWEIMELRRLVKSGTSITYGIVQAGPHIEGGIPYIRTSDMAGDSLPLDGYLCTSGEIDSSYRRSKVQTGDVVVAIRATIGKALPVSPELNGANLTQGTAKVSPGPRLTTEYLLAALQSNSSQLQFGSLAKGTTFLEITLDMLRRFKIPLPPLDEQRAITKFVAAGASKLDRLLRAYEGQIKILVEYRASLIHECVTGQRRVQ